MFINAWGKMLCRVSESSCLPTRNKVPHISWHDPPYCGATKRFEHFPSMAISQLVLRKFWIQTWFCNCQQNLCLFHDVGSPKSTSLLSVLSTSDQCLFLSSQSDVMSHTEKNCLFSRCTNKDTELETSDSGQEEQLGLPYWTMREAIGVVVDESKCLEILNFEFSIIEEHRPFLPGC